MFGRPFQPSLIFTSKAKSYPNEAPLRFVALTAKTDPGFSCGQYYKNILFTNDNPRVVRMTIVGDAPICGDTYDHH